MNQEKKEHGESKVALCSMQRNWKTQRLWPVAGSTYAHLPLKISFFVTLQIANPLGFLLRIHRIHLPGRTGPPMRIFADPSSVFPGAHPGTGSDAQRIR